MSSLLVAAVVDASGGTRHDPTAEWQGRAEAERAITEAQARYVPTTWEPKDTPSWPMLPERYRAHTLVPLPGPHRTSRTCWGRSVLARNGLQ